MKRFISMILGATIAAGLTAYGYQAQSDWPPALKPASKTSPVLSPDEALKSFVLPPGYRLELVASEPLIQDPVFIDWDPDGRMWAVEMPGYMLDITASRELEPLGRIVVFEDTNADGKMDKRTVFADGLVLARALKVLDRGVLVGEPPNLWLMRDTNGDLKMDSRELVTDTYGRRDANVEHNANGLFWAMDNRLYTSETDMYVRLRNGKFEVNKTLSRGPVGTVAGRRRTHLPEHELVGALCRSRADALLHAQPHDAQDARQLRIPRAGRERHQHHLAHSPDRRRQPRLPGRSASRGRNTVVVHRGRGAHHLSRRSSARGTVRQRVRRRAVRQPCQPDHHR